MADYIDKEKLRHAMYHEAFETDTDLQKWDSGCWIRYRLFENIVNALPAADVKPVVHGRWVYNERTCREECSVCGIHNISAFRDFCPNCGADMRGNDNERE